MPTYLETEVGSDAVHTAIAAVVVLVLLAVMIPLVARLSDRIGRRPIYAMATIGNLVLLLPAFSLMHVGSLWSLYLALFLVSLPSACFLALTGAVMSELFPTASRFGCVGVTHNLSISIFGGTTPLVSQILVEVTGNSYAPAFYIMFFSVVALFALLKMRESASRPLLGSVPVVSTRREAAALVEGQDNNEHIDTATMLLTPSGPSQERADARLVSIPYSGLWQFRVSRAAKGPPAGPRQFAALIFDATALAKALIPTANEPSRTGLQLRRSASAERS